MLSDTDMITISFCGIVQSKPNPGRQSRCVIALCILAVLIFLIYSNSFQTSWHFDDYENIANNPRVQIKDLQPSTLFKTFFASPEGKRKPFRSVAYLSFALNAYVGGKQVFGYHAVNIVIHVVTAFLLFITVLKIFETPKLTRRSNNDAFFVALLTASPLGGQPHPNPGRHLYCPADGRHGGNVLYFRTLLLHHRPSRGDT